MSGRSVAEIIGWRLVPSDSPGTWPPMWHGPNGEVSPIGPTPTADDLLAWLRDEMCPDCLTVYVEANNCVTRDDGYPVNVSCCCLPNGEPWPDIYAPTLLAALEAAVRAVAGES